MIILKDSKTSKQEMTNIRLHIYQRFIFLFLRSASEHSDTVLVNHVFQIRVLYLFTDRPQERCCLCLFKDVSSEKICSHCRVKKSDISFHSSMKREVMQTVSAQLEKAVIDGMDIRKRKMTIVLSYRWLQFCREPISAMHHCKTFLKIFLSQESAKAFPPALCIISSVGTKPFRLY